MIPIIEFRLQVILDAILDRIRDNYNVNTDKSNSFLGRLYSKYNKVGKYSMFDNAVEIFVNRNDGSPKKLETRLMFDRQRATLPTIHITSPSEGLQGNGLGLDEDSNNTIGIGESPVNGYIPYQRSFQTSFKLVVTGANTNEVMIIATTLQYALYSNIESLEVNGFQNAKIYKQELNINPEMMPKGYVKAVSLDTLAQYNIPKFDEVSLVNSINFNGEAYD